MGQASRRGTFEQRRMLAIQREQSRLDAIEARKQARYQQQRDAYSVMTWWQIEMSEERHAIFMRAKMETQLSWASLMGMMHGMGWGSFRSLMSR